MIFRMKNEPLCGERHESQLDGYNELIESKDIISFVYNGSDFSVSAKKEDGKIKIACSGGGKYNKRDGSLFKINYETTDDSIFQELQNIIDNNNETKGNGHCITVDGLPSGLGDQLSVVYTSGEKIYKSSNQSKTVSLYSIESFYKIFHNFVKKDGYDFTTDGSNVVLFDDPTEEYLQGTWKGKHFGKDIEVIFKGRHVTIKVDGNITDNDVEYTIYEAFVKRNKLKEGIKEVKSEYDYESFNGVDSFSKMNWFTLTGHFRENGSSSCSLHNFDKTNPDEKK